MKQLLRLSVALLAGIVLPLQLVLAEDLPTAWQAALEKDQRLRAGDSRVAAARADLDVAKAARLPGVAASAGVTRFDQAPAFDFNAAGVPAVLPLFGGESMSMADARVTLPLYTGGRLARGIDAAGAALGAEEHRYVASRQQIKLAVAGHYIDVLRARSALAVADSNVKSLAAHLHDVEDMFKAGAVARNDYLSAAVSLADSEQRRLQARNQLDLASAAYNRSLGRPLTSAVNLDENLPDIDADLDLSSLPALTEIAVASRSELNSLD
ncbi:MAG: TolC family protein, partial [Pseudomonadales bacterium]